MNQNDEREVFEACMLKFGWRDFSGRVAGEPDCWYYDNDELQKRWFGWREGWQARAAAPEAPAQPIDMILHCPACGMRHIDAPEVYECQWPICNCARTDGPPCQAEANSWDNPAHRSHLCHGCGHIWRPADVPTNGVAAIKTKGKADSPAPEAPAQLNPAYRVAPVDPTLEMIDAGAQRLVSWGENSTWPDSWDALQVEAARTEADRCYRSMILVAPGPEAPAQAAQSAGEVEQDRKDAARYRELRRRVYVDPAQLILRIRDTFLLTKDGRTTADQLDAAIDAALNTKEQP